MKFLPKFFIFIILIPLLFQFSAIKVYPGWFKHFGGSSDERGYSIMQTSDGGYIVAGRTESYTHGGRDFAIYRLSSIGGKRWFRHCGGTLDDYALSIQETSDGGFVMAGRTKSYTYGGNDFAIYKLNSSGNKIWFKHYGGVLDDTASSIQQLSTGEYIVVGTSRSYSHGSDDIAIYKLASNGNRIWYKHYGGTLSDQGVSIQQTTDGGYIVAGFTFSYTYGGYDFAIYKLNSSGNKIWFKHYGGTQNDYAYSIQQTSDGGYIVAGSNESYTYGNSDIAIYKLDSKGDQVWFKHYGGTDQDTGSHIQQTSDGGYTVVGSTLSFTNGNYDFAIYKLNSSGNKTWFKHYGGTNQEIGTSIQQISDGGYIVAGSTASFTYGVGDFAIYKLDSAGNK